MSNFYEDSSCGYPVILIYLVWQSSLCNRWSGQSRSTGLASYHHSDIGMAPPTRSTSSKDKDENDSGLQFISGKIDSLFTEMRDFREETKAMGISIESTHEKIDELKTVFSEHRVDIDKCLADLESLKTENKVLKDQLVKVREEVNNQQQYSRRNTVDIQGVPEAKSENLLEVVKSVARVLRFKLSSEMVDAVHRLPGSRGDSRPRGIILKFVRRMDCDELLRLSKVKRGFSAAELLIQSDSKVYVNASLSKTYRELLFLAKRAARGGIVKYAWYNNGKILVRKTDGQPAIHITSREQLAMLGMRDGSLDSVGDQQDVKVSTP